MLIVSAFVKINALKQIDNDLNSEKIEKKILVRFRKEDVLHGSTDIELYRYCVNNGWKLYIDMDLHSKIFVFDKKRFCIGSANVTLSGLGLVDKSNIETICQGNLAESDYISIREFFKNAIAMDEFIFAKMYKDYNNTINHSSIESKSNLRWSTEILEELIQIPKKLWVSELIFSASPYDMNSRDRALLGLSLKDSTDLENVKKHFKSLKCYRWLSNVFNEEIYFGRLASELHDAIIDNPEIYRKEVKILLSNLLNWINELAIEEFVIDRPNYSQRVRKVF